MSRVREDRKSSDPIVADAPSGVPVVEGRAAPGDMIVLLASNTFDVTLETKRREIHEVPKKPSIDKGRQPEAKETTLCASRGTAMKRSEDEGTSAAVALTKEAIGDRLPVSIRTCYVICRVALF